MIGTALLVFIFLHYVKMHLCSKRNRNHLNSQHTKSLLKLVKTFKKNNRYYTAANY